MQDNFIKIISLNIEKDKHLDRVIPFLKEQKADIILLQEVLSKDIARFEEDLAMKSAFAIMKVFLGEGEDQPFGLATFSAFPMTNRSFYYRGSEENPPKTREGDPLNTARVILVSEILQDKKKFCLINTHFTWTPNGQANNLQYEDLPKLLYLLSQMPDFVMCGDLNAPRGRVIFDEIASIYKDHIPSSITTTIDKDLHRAGDLQLVVDCLFSTPHYLVKDVELFDGLSDHYAVVAKIFSKHAH